MFQRPGLYQTIAFKNNKVNELPRKKEEKSSLKQPATALLPGSSKFTSMSFQPKKKFRQRRRDKSTDSLGKELASKSMKVIDDHQYTKHKNLKLKDYLMLTSLSKKSMAEKTADEKVRPSMKMSAHQKTIDTAGSIRMIKQSTQRQLREVEDHLQELVKEINECSEITGDQQSLVFMCSVLNVFEQKICRSVKYANELLDEHKKKKQIQSLKNYGKVEIKETKMRHSTSKRQPQSATDLAKSEPFFYKSFSKFT